MRMGQWNNKMRKPRGEEENETMSKHGTPGTGDNDETTVVGGAR
jgi:hypothetical protein